MTALLVFGGGVALVFAAIGGPEATGFRTLVVAGVALLVVGLVAGPKRPLSSSGDCWIDWDGRANAEVCD